MKKLFLAVSFFLTVSVYAASVDTVAIYSAAMHKNIKTVVIKPSSDNGERLPVVYLLHGAFGSYSNWVSRVPHIKELVDRYRMIVVCPDGGFTSWYFDSPVDPNYQYETFVGVEVPQYIDAHYNTIADRKGRAITGLSMGGHGGIFLGFRHADLYSACGSTSGALHVSVITRGYDVEKRLGDTAANKKYWTDWSALNVVEHYPKDSLAITMDCGTEDMVLPMNRAMHEKMLRLKIPHDYTERPGQHNWAYWNISIDYQLLFFRNHFDKMLKHA
ncbi:MAG: esterase family protein [Chitinophagaceae bacterium]|nr:esterase family protein [Chitinophagaceae bacterium]